MFRHIVFFEFKSDTTDNEVEALREALATMPELMPFIRRYEMGTDPGLIDEGADMALVADFDSADDWRTYAEHPDHLAVTESFVKPITETVRRAQYQL